MSKISSLFSARNNGFIALLLISILLIVINQSARSQSNDYEYGEISMDELQMTSYPADRSAEAVILYDIGKSYFLRVSDRFQLVFERTTKIKILTDAGVEYANVEIPYNDSKNATEVVKVIQARSCNLENGTQTVAELEKDNVYDEKVSEFTSVKKFALPDVRAGSVIEFQYTISSENSFFLQDWNFQHSVPTQYSEYEVRLIPFYEYTWLMQGAATFDEYKSWEDTRIARQFGAVTFNDMVHKFVIKDVPAFEDEDYITTINDYLIKISFQLSRIIQPDGFTRNVISTWPEMIKELLEMKSFGGYMKKSKSMATKIAPANLFSIKDPEEKMKAIVGYVKQNYAWDRKNRMVAYKTVKDFVEERSGNSAELNLFLCGLLQAAGLETYPVILSTRNHGKIAYDYPYVDFFNYVLPIVKIGGKYILTDATESMLNYNCIPPQCINDQGLIIDEEHVNWARLVTNYPSESNIDISIRFSSDLDTLYSNLTRTFTDYEALDKRNNFAEDREKINQVLLYADYNVAAKDIQIKNSSTMDKPYILTFKTSLHAEKINDRIYFSPFLSEPISENPFKQDSRVNPIDMTYPIKRTFQSIIYIPEGYEVDYIPENFNIPGNGYQFDFIANNENNDRIIFIASYLLSQSVYPASDYSKLKSFYRLVIEHLNDKVVLKKI